MRRDLLIAWLLALCATLAVAAEAPPAAENPEIEKRMLAITAELRCLVCQNQTVADSHAPLAEDLRHEVRLMLARGASNQEVIDFMTQRYGDFVLYRPPVKGTTLFLWFGPALLMVGGIAGLVWTLRRRNRLPAEQFEPDVDD